VDLSDPRVGQLVGGHRVIGRVGAGAMGVVYLADRQEEPTRPVALKLLPRGASDEARARFKREILAQSFFSHRSVIDVYDAGETEAGDPWLAMEFLDASDLEELLLDPARPLSARRAVLIAAQVLRGLAAAHAAKVVHRDVKPGNVLVTRDLEVAKLMDFGIAVIGDLGEFEQQVFHSLEGTVTGTPEYMSPEQASGDRVGPPGDVYSLGCVLYRALSGRLPYESETSQGFLSCHILEEPRPLAQADPRTRALPPELHALVSRLLGKEPAARPTATQAARELETLAPRLKDAASTGGFSLRGLLRWR
jgi:serine/threonine-protein kinase